MIDCFCQPIKSDDGCINGKGWNIPVGSRSGGRVFVFASVFVWRVKKKNMSILTIYVPLTRFLSRDRP